MNCYRFYASGHENILSTHPNTLEFTKDADLTKRGDCIVGVRADFNSHELKKALCWKKIRARLSCEGEIDEFSFLPNMTFCDEKELVIRIGEFCSDRTFGIRSDKASVSLNRRMIDKMKDPRSRMEIIFENEEETA